MTDRQKKPEDSDDPAISRLYRATRDAEPGAALEARILAEARAAAHHRHRRWLLPVSSAAVVLLGLTLTLKLQDQAPRLPQTLEDFSAEMPAESPAVRRAEKKLASPAPGMMRESDPGGIEENRLQLQKSAPEGSVTTGSSFDAMRERDEAEISEHDVKALQADEVVEDPAAWLERIQNSLRRGERSKAIQELKAFSSRYPEYPIPEKLQALDPD